jgi:hypothetical protein
LLALLSWLLLDSFHLYHGLVGKKNNNANTSKSPLHCPLIYSYLFGYGLPGAWVLTSLYWHYNANSTNVSNYCQLATSSHVLVGLLAPAGVLLLGASAFLGLVLLMVCQTSKLGESGVALSY